MSVRRYARQQDHVVCQNLGMSVLHPGQTVSGAVSFFYFWDLYLEIRTMIKMPPQTPSIATYICWEISGTCDCHTRTPKGRTPIPAFCTDRRNVQRRCDPAAMCSDSLPDVGLDYEISMRTQAIARRKPRPTGEIAMATA